MLFRNGVNATFTMHGSSHREGRETRIDGTRGSLRGGFYNVERSLELPAGRVHPEAYPAFKTWVERADEMLNSELRVRLR